MSGLPSIIPWRVRRVSLLCVAALALGGCDQFSTHRAADGQVAARVNDSDITIHQVEYALQRSGAPTLERGEGAARRALDQLVEQEIAAQAARQDGLDRDPAVIQALEATRREVLARAWQDRLASRAAGASSDEVDRYFDAHPTLFAERRIYVLQEALVDARDADVARVQQIAREARGAQAVEESLRQAGLRFRTRQFPQAAENLPMVLLEPLARLSAGESIVLPPERAGTRVYTVMRADAAPVDRRTAAPAIASFLLADRKRSAVDDGMKPLRDKAHVEYRGNFASPASAASVPVGAGG